MEREITCSIEAARACVREQLIQIGARKGMDCDIYKSVYKEIYYLDASAYRYTDLADGEDEYPQFTCVPCEMYDEKEDIVKLVGAAIIKGENIYDHENRCYYGVSNDVDIVNL